MSRLKDHGIPTAIYYPIPLHLQGAYKYLGYAKDSFAVTESVAGKIFSIPMHPYLTEEEQKSIADAMAGAGTEQ